MRTRRSVAVVLAVTALSGCGHHDQPAAGVRWHLATALPTAAGTRAVVSAVAYCAGRWYVVGATATADGSTRPAVWSSSHLTAWRTVPLHPGGDYYAAREILGSAGCSRGRLAALGAKPGGAHGLPRTATWRLRRDGSLAAVHAPFDLYGGGRAVAVSRLEGGPHGFLIAGTRTSGAAVWASRRGDSFRIVEDAPGLANTARTRTQAVDAAWAGAGWVVVGLVAESSGAVSAAAWTPAAHGAWTRQPLPGGGRLTTAERVVDTADGPVVAGLADQRFGLWARRSGAWSLVSTFGRRDPAGTEAPYVSSLADTGAGLVAAYSDGAHFRLAEGTPGGTWRDLAAPTDVTVAGDHALAVAGRDGRILLVTDDGAHGRVWVGDLPH